MPFGRRGAGRGAAARTQPARSPHPAGQWDADERVCTGCGRPSRTRDEAADLAVDWLVVDTGTDPATDSATGAAHGARFHQACRPAGIPGELACAGCGDGPLLDPTLTAVPTGTGGPVDLVTAAALTGWLDDHGWTGDQAAGEGPRWPTFSPRSVRTRQSAAAGARR